VMLTKMRKIGLTKILIRVVDNEGEGRRATRMVDFFETHWLIKWINIT